jgi:hypothetical protein
MTGHKTRAVFEESCRQDNLDPSGKVNKAQAKKYSTSIGTPGRLVLPSAVGSYHHPKTGETKADRQAIPL